MPRYFFDTHNGAHDPDNVGTQLSGEHEALTEAVKLVGQSLAEDPALITCGQDLRVEVRSESGLLMFAVTAFVNEFPAGWKRGKRPPRSNDDPTDRGP